MKTLLSAAALLLTAALISAASPGCSSIKYKDDFGFSVSAQANSPEFPVYVNNTLCRDSDGILGACTKRIRSSDDVVLRFDPTTYAYNVHVVCSSGANLDANHDVPAGQPFSILIMAAQMASFRSLTCKGVIAPKDREQAVTARFELKLIIMDKAYAPREQASLFTKGKKHYLLLGEHARVAHVYDCNEDGESCQWETHTHAPIIRVRSPQRVRAYSESYNMRFNYFEAAGA